MVVSGTLCELARHGPARVTTAVNWLVASVDVGHCVRAVAA